MKNHKMSETNIDCDNLPGITDYGKCLCNKTCGSSKEQEAFLLTLQPIEEAESLVELTPKEEFPGVVKRLKTFTKAIAKWALAGCPTRTKEEVEEIFKICSSCEHFTGSHCNQCGCYCIEENRLVNKLTIKTEHCPLNKW